MTDQAALIKKSKYIPDDWKVPVGGSALRTIKAHKKRFFKYRYRLIECRRVELQSLSDRYHLLMRDMEDFISRNEWFEAQMRQSKDICRVLNDPIEEEDCPDEYDHEEILRRRHLGWCDALVRFTEQHPIENDMTVDQYARQNELIKMKDRTGIEYRRWLSGKGHMLPSEERKDACMLTCKAGVMSDYIQERLIKSDLTEKTLIPDMLRSRDAIAYRTGRVSGWEKEFGIVRTVVLTPVLPPSLDKQEELDDRIRPELIVNVIKEGHPDTIKVEK